VGPVPVGHPPPPGGEVQGRIDGDESGFFLPAILQDFLVPVKEHGLGPAFLEKTDSGGPVGHAGQIQADDGRMFFSPQSVRQPPILEGADHQEWTSFFLSKTRH
jgi:hypothetical protein